MPGDSLSKVFPQLIQVPHLDRFPVISPIDVRQTHLPASKVDVVPLCFHRGGVNVAFADGHTRLVSNRVDVSVWRDYASRNGGAR